MKGPPAASPLRLPKTIYPRLFVLALLLFLAADAAAPTSVSGQSARTAPFPSYEIRGEILDTPVQGSRPTWQGFTVMANASNWCITTCHVPGEPSRTNFYWKVFNVTSNYFVMSQWVPQLKRNHAQIKALPAPVKVPDQATHFLWLTLTPSIRADEQGRVRLPPVYNPSADLGTNPDLRLDCLVEYLDLSKVLPRSIVFASDGTFNRFVDGRNYTQHYSPPYDKGFVEASFEVTSITNWNGLAIPLQIVGRIFRPGSTRAGPELALAEKVEITITNIQSLTPGQQLPPAIEPDTIISDTRIHLHPNQPLTYTLNGGPWPDLETSLAAFEGLKTSPAAVGRFLPGPTDSNSEVSTFSMVPLGQTLTNFGHGPFRLDFTGLPHGAYYILGSTNLTKWKVLPPPVNVGSNRFQFIDPDTNNLPHRYYQIHLR
jgi:hypothetical protein